MGFRHLSIHVTTFATIFLKQDVTLSCDLQNLIRSSSYQNCPSRSRYRGNNICLLPDERTNGM